MSDSGPLILLTNDDGIHAEGLRYLRMAASKLGRVFIVAPESEQSAIGHAITLHEPIRVRRVVRDGEFYGFGINGTPADAVKLAVHSLLPAPPDLVISGINDGANMGINVLYSGTVSAALEAAILGVPAVAVSLTRSKKPLFDQAVPLVQAIAGKVLRNGLPKGVALAVNIPALPAEEIQGFKLTRQGLNRFGEEFQSREDPRGYRYYWLAGERLPQEVDERSDVHAVRRGFVSITPLFYDLTAHKQTELLSDTFEEFGSG